MMSPTYWNLPKPGLIISVTGSAEEFEEDVELSAHDQPYVLFKVRLPNAGSHVFVPVGRPTETLKCISLSDVLYRIADYVSQSPKDFSDWGVDLVASAKEALDLKEGCSLKSVKLVMVRQVVDPQNSKKEKSERSEESIPVNSQESLISVFEALTNDSHVEFFWECPSKGGSMNAKKHMTFEFCKLLEDKEVFGESVNSHIELEFCNRVEEFLSKQKNPQKMKDLEESVPNPFDPKWKLKNDARTTKDILKQDASNRFEFQGDDTIKLSQKAKENYSRAGKAVFMAVHVFENEEIADLQRRIENLSLGLFPSPLTKDGKTAEDISKRFLTLPQPIWKSSTLILRHSAVDDQSRQLHLFSKDEFKEFMNFGKSDGKGAQDPGYFFLLRTQGTGCNQTKDVIQRILHQVAFLLPLQFGSVWMITGGTNKGIMQVDCVRLTPSICHLTFCTQYCGNVLASLSGKGQHHVPMSQMVLIGIAATGPIVKVDENSKDLDSIRKRMELLQENYKISKDVQQSQPATPNSNKSWSLKNTLTKTNKTFVDTNHSHLCLVGDESSEFGSEIPFRSEIERYVSEKFGIPMLQFVFGGGVNTVATTLGFQGAPNAFSCIVKGSGRFCYAIERCLELKSKLEKNTKNREYVGWLLQTAKFKPDSNRDKSISNHDFGQIESIISNEAK
jgi:hypothetical protein